MSNTAPVIVVGIDPGTGVKSPCGVAAFTVAQKTILLAANVSSKQRNQLKNLRCLPEEVYQTINEAVDVQHDPQQVKIYLEEIVMRGKGGVTLQRHIGAVISRFPMLTPIDTVGVTRVKRLVTGNGDAEKREVGLGVIKFFGSNPESESIVKDYFEDSQWDILDAFAIAIAGLMYNEEI